jgi:hypothetical protein
MELTNDLTPQQWALAQYLEDIFCEDERTVITKEMICGNFPETYSRLNESTTDYNSTAYRKIRQDINAIKKSKCWHHVLITDGNRGYKIATLEEAKKALFKEKKRAWNIYKRILIMKSYIKTDNYAYIDFENEEIKFNHFFD